MTSGYQNDTTSRMCQGNSSDKQSLKIHVKRGSLAHFFCIIIIKKERFEIKILTKDIINNLNFAAEI